MPALSTLPDASIYGNVQAPKAMSIQEMVDLGRTSTALQREKTLLPSAIQLGQAQAKTATLTADTAQLDNTLKNMNAIIQDQQTLLTKPDLTSDDIIEKAKAFSKRFNTPKESLEQALAGIPVNGSPNDLRAYLATNLAKTLGSVSQLEKMYPGGILPSQLPQGGYQPNVQGTETPASATAPAVAPTTAPKTGVQPQDMSQPVKTDLSKPVPLSYPIRQAGQAYTALPQEEDERKVGTASKTALIARQSELPASRRNVDEVIKKAMELEKSATLPTSGVLGSLERNVSTFFGTEQGIRYKELSKDLANAAIANIKATGGSMDTVAGQQLQRMANGDETYPPKVLIEIARRTQADMTALDSKATAIKKFSDKFGDQNLKSFEQMWSKNADPKIFQAMNIFNDPRMSKEEKAKARDELLGTDKNQLRIFNEQYNNVKKLEQTGTL
jgi:hypothetical protein